MDRIKVLIVEDQETMREAYKTILTIESSIGLVGVRNGSCFAMGDVEDIKKTLLDKNPHILLVGIKSINARTIEVLEAVNQDFPDIGIVLMAQCYETESMIKLKKFAKKNTRGAYLLKSSVDKASEIIRIIKDVMRGQIIVDPQIFTNLMQPDEKDDSHLSELPPSELEILNWLAMGYKNSAIAQMLCLELDTVERHINNIYGKLIDDFQLKHSRAETAFS